MTLAAAVTLLAACGIDMEPDVKSSASSLAGVQLDPEVAEEAWLLYQELLQRLEERGATLEELQAAVNANDEEAIREMFGLTDERLRPCIDV